MEMTMNKTTKKFLKLSLAASLLIYPMISSAFFCPTNFNQIDFGMTPEQVIQSCGAPQKQNQSIKVSDNVPQEWSYFVPQTVSMRGSTQNAQGSLKSSVTFNSQGKVINLTVNGIGVGASTVCGSIIQLGDSKDAIKSACGTPAFINKQTPSPDAPAPADTKVLEFDYLSANPPATLIFENGKLTDKR